MIEDSSNTEKSERTKHETLERKTKNNDLFIENEIYYHIQNEAWKCQSLQVGQTIFAGRKKNPFVEYYDHTNFTIQDPQTKQWYNYSQISNSMVKYVNTKEKDKHLAKFYHFKPEETVKELTNVLNDYVLLVREWIFEEVRMEFFPNLPSRQRCLWVIPEDRKSIQYWWDAMNKGKNAGINGRVLKLELTGKIYRTNQQYLAPTTDSLDNLRMNAFKYWAGASGSNSAEDEYIFEGFAKILEVVSPEHFGIK
jgi:hypothetical protein